MMETGRKAMEMMMATGDGDEFGVVKVVIGWAVWVGWG